MKIKRILLAEDDSNDVELILAALEEHNLANEITVVRDGEEALNYLFRRGPFESREDELPALMLLDIKMPKVDGLEVLRQVKNDDRLKLLPIVVLTSSREEQDLIESYQLGTNAYVVKPVEFDNFMTVVKQLGLFWILTNELPGNM